MEEKKQLSNVNLYQEIEVDELNTNFGKLIWQALLQPVILQLNQISNIILKGGDRMKGQNKNETKLSVLKFEEVTSEELNGWGSYALGVAVGAGGSLAVAVAIT